MRSADPGVGLLQFDDEAVNLCQELGATGMRTVGDQLRRMISQPRLPGHAGPTPDFAIGQQRDPSQVATPARVPQIAEEVLKSESQWK